MNTLAIEVSKLKKQFGRFVAVDGIDFKVRKGEIFGFLGANGAGKSTTIRMLCGLLSSTSGTATVAGFDINTQPEQIKANIGYMSQRFSLYDDLTVRENITFFGGTYGLKSRRFIERMKWVVQMAGLKGMEDNMTKSLPGGWKQRLALGCAVIHEPQIVFLDEPTSGVDPISRRDFWDLINTVSELGSTVFVTTHYLEEAEYCNNIVLIHAGRIVASGSPSELKSKYISDSLYEIECDNVLLALEILKRDDAITETSMFGNLIHISTADQEIENRARGLLAERSVSLKRIEPIVPSLEDVFIHLVQEKPLNEQAKS
ncbi:MAG: ABC transporter ATP-binding protein [candidate division Zixibacteria bacterium]|nr:ABC transporter ATP-binding protein [candidate division Zixibacteria bacterium]MBU1470825.1 ABC transporter ATP-binding protein [candidate division Zixibacteria bacterium]MBU2625755.1 ABC transporter ATP-binding protein [candidate division Zixibacteria bacterium]